MLKLWLTTILSTFFVSHFTTADVNGCLPLPVSHFQWQNPDGSLVIPQFSSDVGILSENENKCSCCGQWIPLPGSPNCQYCSSNSSLLCHGSNVYDVPDPATLPSTTLSLFQMSGVGLIFLPPKAFIGLSIEKLVIANSNLSCIASDTFTGVKSIKRLYLRNNTLDYLPHAEFLFANIHNLEFLALEYNGLKVLSSIGTANMHFLNYFSLAGNPLYTMDVHFLQNSSLTFLNLRNIMFKLRTQDIKDTGFSRLPSSLNALDLSGAVITSEAIIKIMYQLRGKNITTLSLGNLQLSVPSFWALRPIQNTLQYLSLQGTDLSQIFSSTKNETHPSKSLQFINMVELNLKNCNIANLGNGEIFKTFPNLLVLSLAQNQIFIIDLTLFLYLPRMIYMDLSGMTLINIIPSMNSVSSNLEAIDLSSTYLGFNETESTDFFNVLPNLQVASFCTSLLDFTQVKALQNVQDLKYLDLSSTLIDTFSTNLESAYNDLFSNTRESLVELHFAQNNFKFSDEFPSFFSQLTTLEVLDLSNNFVRELSDEMFSPALKILNVSYNLITTWYFPLLNNESQLQFLDATDNQITYISDAMIEDFYKLNSLSLNSNPLICHKKVVSLVCSNIKNNTQSVNDTQGMHNNSDNVQNDTQGMHNNSDNVQNDTDIMKNNSQTLTIIGWQQYKCYDLFLKGYRQFSEERDCKEYYEEVSTTHGIEEPTTASVVPSLPTTQPNSRRSESSVYWEWMYLVVGLIVMICSLGSIIYLKWWNIKCYFHRYFSLKRAQLLQKSENLFAKPEIYYDVFVSYSDVDRAWILDHLVPNMEGDKDISLCFHERDFQVGMTILENILDCMDRSHALLLVVSRAFVHSKWCQFEMHLAQYRMIETFRDQLVLVLLEDIPRKARPQTLHHLMMTKTYLMWPQQPCKDDAIELFWQRLKRALRPNPNYTLNL